MISTAIVSENSLLRAGYRTRLNTDHEIAVVSEAGIGAATIDDLIARQPDVIVVDHSPPQVDAVDFTERVHETDIRSQIVVVSDITECRFIHRVMQVGASGYLGKCMPLSMLITAIKTAAAGYRFVDPLLVAMLIAPDTEQLSAREIEVLQLYAEDLSPRMIAVELGVGETTVNWHIRRTMEKLQASSRAEAVKICRQASLIS